jgi:hypothetical protein
MTNEQHSFLERDFAPLAQFQLLTLCVWIAELLIVISLIRSGQPILSINSRWILAIIHPMPWYVGLRERKRLLQAEEIMPPAHKIEPSAVQSVIRILWASYWGLAFVEFAFISW